jgi:hypothetical protein
VISSLKNAREAVVRHLADADPDRVTTAQAAELVALFAEIERLGAAGKVVYTKRAAESTVWRDEGHRSAAAWMAETTKTGMGDAIATLETATALQSLPATSDALRRGDLSAPQVKVIAAAAVAHPRSESELLKAAATDSLKGLKERCAQVRAAASSAKEELERYNAIRAARYVRHWADPDGAFRLDAKLTPDAGAKLLSALEGDAGARFAEARKTGEREAPAAYLADALVSLVTGDPTFAVPEGSLGSSRSTGSARSTTSTRSTVCIRVDASALRRGYAKRGETCHIPGVGPVPVAVATRQLSDAFVKVLVTDGVDVTTVCHVGRSVPAHVQSALEERDPKCVVPGCDVAHGLENHHWDVPYAECGTSTLAGLARVCAWHHDLLTYDGYVLAGGAGRWEMRAPPGGRFLDFDTG